MGDQLSYRLLLEKIDRAFSERALALCLTSIKELIETDSRLVEKYRVRIGLLEWHQDKSKKSHDSSAEKSPLTPLTDWQEDKTTSVAKFQNELGKCIGYLKKDEIIDSFLKSENVEEKNNDFPSKFKVSEIRIRRKNIDLKGVFGEFRRVWYRNLPPEIESVDDLSNQGPIVLNEVFDEGRYVEVEIRVEENLNLIRFYYREEEEEEEKDRTEYFVNALYKWWCTQLQKVNIFISYSHRDSEWKDALKMQFYSMSKRGMIDQFDDSQIKPGQEWEPSIVDRIKRSDIILFLVSPDLLHSEYIDKKELPLAEKLHKEKKSVVIPIFVRWINVEGTFLGQIQGFPNADAKYGYRVLDKAPNREEALYHVVEDVGKFVNEIYSKR